MQPPPPGDVVAAGAVVARRGAVLLVHRPRYDDWSFPKGKLDPGEHATVAAVREVAEETGLAIRLGPPLGDQRYRSGDKPKTVHYWAARVVGDHDVSGYRPNHEIDAVEWVPWEEAAARLTYPHDRDTLAEARPVRRRTRALVVLRHAETHPRASWRGDDRRRPLVPEGEEQARRLAPVLAAYDVTTVVTSTSTRCADTVAPYCREAGLRPRALDDLSEEDATTGTVVDLVDELLELDEGVVVCTHRPVLPTVMDAVGVTPVALAKGAMLVVHHRRGRVVTTEVHEA
jgi:8-oxo-(d)GTP phosphatase